MFGIPAACDCMPLNPSFGAGRQTTPSVASNQSSLSRSLLLSSRSSGHDLMHAASDEMQRRIKVHCLASYSACIHNVCCFWHCPGFPTALWHSMSTHSCLTGSTTSSATRESWTAFSKGGWGPTCRTRYCHHMLHCQPYSCAGSPYMGWPPTHATQCRVYLQRAWHWKPRPG